jgi:dipeptidyl aminopeptidase/acylaminoacyl peptidase
MNGIQGGLRQAACAALACLGLAAACSASGATLDKNTGQSQPPAAPSAEDFARMPAIAEVEPSPDGRHLALLMTPAGGHVVAAVMDLDPIGKPRIVAAFSDADVRSIDWVNDHRLIYSAYQRQYELERGGGGTFAVEQDGSGQRQLIAAISNRADVSNVSISSKLLPWGWSLRSTIDDGSNDVLVVKALTDSAGEPQGYDLVRLNTVTGTRESLSTHQPDHTYGFELDAHHMPRVLQTRFQGREQIWWRPDDEARWRSIADFEQFDAKGFTPWMVDADGSIIVAATAGQDTVGLYKLDPSTGRIGADPFLRVPGFDIESAHAVIDDHTRRLMGVRYETDDWHTYWLDPALASIQKGLDRALPPGRVNRLICGDCATSRFIVVKSWSDRQPGEYYLFDRQKGSLQFVAATRPWIREAQQGTRKVVRVAARDGLELPVYVTSPPGAAADKPLPTIVLPHGGPYLRGESLAWDGEAQFYATRGWRVLQPEFRGSTGYGWALFHAGWKQWGQAMEDDLTDTVAWAVKQGLTDAHKVCIVGGSYGGYAALMGPVRAPGVYRCAVSFAGVTELDLMYAATWSDASDEYKRYGMPTLIGDRDKDAAMLARYSPDKRAAEIKVPLLVMQGAADRRVPIEHERAFVSAARAAGVSVEEVIYPDEGHGFNQPEDRADYLRRVQAFVGKAFEAAH